MSGLPTECSDVSPRRNAGSSSRREPDDDGVPIVLGGVTTAQGTEESSVQGKGEQVAILQGKRSAGREMRKPCLTPNVPRKATGEPYALKGACTVLRGADGKGPQRVPRQPPTLPFHPMIGGRKAKLSIKGQHLLHISDRKTRSNCA